MSELRTGGEDTFGKFVVIAHILRKFATGAGIVAFTVVLIGLDLVLGPRYLFTVAEVDHIPMKGLAVLAPWIFSLSTTGLLYALWSRPQRFKARGYVDFLAIGIAIADTLVDVGGFNALIFHDANVGSRILLPFNAPLLYQFFEAVVGLFCFAHMPLLNTILGRYQHRVNREDGDTFGDQVEASLVYLAGWVFNICRSIAVAFGSLTMFCLDLILTPLVGSTTQQIALLFILSIVLTCGQYALWTHFVHVAKGPSEGGGILTRMTVRAYRGKLPKSARLVWLLTAVCTVIDSLFDLAGFNKTLYGHASLVPIHPTIAWLLVAFMMLAMCSAQAAIATEIFDPLARHHAKPREEFDGGLDDFGSDDGA